ncbi:hypothetical protein RR46_11956 [Papilio xuthus]|uniref:Uncharacterized protein n=1 Tax=Papilio xuthus TaxID=66420 RepID=A0A194PNQ9_PAPXU|nr:hypothetical protein RR46_11956 [Papilio xuthus]
MHTMDTMGTMYGHKKYRPPISPTSFYHHDYYSRHATLRPQRTIVDLLLTPPSTPHPAAPVSFTDRRPLGFPT